ncbi:MAG: hypothetical protein EHM40_03295 [Chloroflexi bacterium]|nr:MAG: hypothetical protein EHM40_03295 [Chloroflexota bacterium]
MSGLIVGLVLRAPITDAFNTEAKFIATVYADHAWEDGTHAHPAVETVSRITGLSVRSVQRYVHRVLEPIGMLMPDGKGPRGTNQYRFPLESGADGSVRLKLRGVTPVSPRQADGGDRESGDRESGDTMLSPKQTTRPLIHEEEEKAPRVFAFSSELQAELNDLGVFVSTWVHVEKRLAAGWTETDALALVDWMSKTRRAKASAAQGFVTRVKEGTKAPNEFYDFAVRKLSGRWYPGRSDVEPGPAVDDEPEELQYFFLGADETVTDEIRRAWQSVLDQVRGDMARGTFDAFVRDTLPVHFAGGVLQVAADSEDIRIWLESRMVSTVQRLLVGIMNQSVVVEFVLACSVAAETEGS